MIDEIRKRLQRVPFIPFLVRTSDGHEYAIPMHDHAFITPRGNRVIVVDDEGTTNGMKATRWRRFLISSITAALYQKLPLTHHLLTVEPDIEIAADAVDVRFGDPVCPGVLGVRMAKGDVDARNFFVLQNMADDAGAGGVRANGELADAITVLIGAGLGAKFVA